jgi:hypothetical protein
MSSGQPEGARQRRESRLAVVHDEDAGHAALPAASSMWNVAPRPGALSTQILPE